MNDVYCPWVARLLQVSIHREFNMVPFYFVFPEVAKQETRVLHTRNAPHLPDDTYSFVELYCLDPACDCRRVLLHVYRGDRPVQVASINHSFELPAPEDEDLGQIFLDPINVQSELSAALLDAYMQLLLPDAAYQQRLQRHYAMVKEAVADPAHPVQRLVRQEQSQFLIQPFQRTEPKIGRNQSCPCGSGQKYKRCRMKATTSGLQSTPRYAI